MTAELSADQVFGLLKVLGAPKQLVGMRAACDPDDVFWSFVEFAMSRGFGVDETAFQEWVQKAYKKLMPSNVDSALASLFTEVPDVQLLAVLQGAPLPRGLRAKSYEYGQHTIQLKELLDFFSGQHSSLPTKVAWPLLYYIARKCVALEQTFDFLCQRLTYSFAEISIDSLFILLSYFLKPRTETLCRLYHFLSPVDALVLNTVFPQKLAASVRKFVANTDWVFSAYALVQLGYSTELNRLLRLHCQPTAELTQAEARLINDFGFAKHDIVMAKAYAAESLAVIDRAKYLRSAMLLYMEASSSSDCIRLLNDGYFEYSILNLPTDDFLVELDSKLSSLYPAECSLIHIYCKLLSGLELNDQELQDVQSSLSTYMSFAVRRRFCLLLHKRNVAVAYYSMVDAIPKDALYCYTIDCQ